MCITEERGKRNRVEGGTKRKGRRNWGEADWDEADKGNKGRRGP